MSVQICNFPLNPRFALRPRSQTAARSTRIFARAENESSRSDQQQLNLSVLRFTFGIPGLDESYLPRWIGYGFGSLILLNHFSASPPINESQLRSEALGLSLAAFSVALPYFGKFLKGSEVEKRSLPEEGEQVFVISSSIGDSLKEDLAWATYVLLRNTSTVAVMISIQGELCVRGYWNCPGQMSKAQLHDWFKRKVDEIGLADVKETLYFPQYAGSALSWDILPDGTRSVFVQPLVQNTDESEKMDGFLLVASTAGYAYSDKDRAWIGAMADKFRG
ncbi:protein COFACTOR ASSEMBLY OF COMPLEX C SUBUNIT B CCB2, chloroplastic [Brassica rapa]|uniref:protein COFACTOR ASSEMBLY OF COMPLEX C SUBUNIT B CCB2, chloroplastic n=1 Tax=Brassica campestris TaxID=3711 RepID=UPI0004F1977C|nr:protein COFACTOR ASSEMBLY OF COMPLEX C SUBUNIT B CCB2, chloroplastic [Brassica rapa]